MEPVSKAERSEPHRFGAAARKTVVAGVGGAVTAVGVVMLVTPGPGILVSLAGLGILAKEFPSVEYRLRRLRDRVRGSQDENAG